MPNPIQILRSAVTGNRPPAGKLPGEPYVNWADRQFGVVDAAGATQDLIGVRHWSAEAAYAKDDHVIQDGRMYSARDAIAPGPFVEALWFRLTRKRLYAPLQLYVDGATGNDLTGDGSQAAPWATVYQAGAWIARELDINGQNVIVRVAAGDYDFANFSEMFGGGIVNIWGAGKDVTNIRKINAVNSGDTRIVLMAMTLKPIAGDYAFPINNSRVQIEGVTGFAIDLTLTTYGATTISFGGSLWTYGPIEIRTNGLSGANCFRLQRGCEWLDDGDWTLTGAAPNTYSSFVQMEGSRYVGNGSYTGASLGKRFALTNGCICDTTATIVRDGEFDLTVTPGDASTRRLDLFPGDQPGTWDSSCWYDGVQGGSTYDDPLGDATFYVEVTGSNTTGDGSQAKPWASLRAAYDHLALYREISGVVTINLGPGDHAYATLFWPGLTGNGIVDILGAGSASSSVDGIFIHGPDSGPTPNIYVNKLTIKSTYNASYQVAAYNGAHVVLGDRMAQVNDVVIDNAIGLIKPPIHADTHGFISTANSLGGVIELRQNGCTYPAVIELSSGGRYEERANWTLSGTPDTCTLGFLSASGDSNYVAATGAPIIKQDERAVEDDAAAPLIVTGPQPIGPKFNLSDQSSVQTNGKQGAAAAAPGGLDFLPGTLPGVLDASSSYDGVNGGPKPRRKADWGDAFYVDAAGNDANDGGSASTAWATLQRAADFFSNEYDFGIVGVTVTIGVGTFVGPKMFNLRGGGGSGGSVTFKGAGIDQTIVTENNAGSCFYAENFHGRIIIKEMTMRAAPGYAAFLVDECLLYLNSPLALETALIGYGSESYIYVNGAIELRMTGANAGNAFDIKSHSHFVDAATWTLSGATPNNYANWVSLDEVSYYQHAGATYAGSTTGKRFSGTHGSIFNSGGRGVDLLPGDTPGTLDASSYYDGQQGNHREVLTANRDYFIDMTGSDANTGSQLAVTRDDVTGLIYGPWATLRKAFDTIAKDIDFNGFTITLNLGAGVFAGSWCDTLTGGGALYIKGAGSTLTTIGDAATGTCVQVYGNNTEKRTAIYLNRVTLIPGNSYYAIYVIDGGFVRIGDALWVDPIDLVFSTINTPQYLVFLTGALSQFVTGDGAISVLMNGVAFYSMFLIQGGALLDVDQAVWTYTGTPDTMTDAFIKLDDSEYVWRSPCAHVGPVIGKRFDLKHWSMVRKTGGTIPANLFPGTLPGTWDGSSFYDGVQGGALIPLTANLNLYVEATGSDTANDGMSVATAFATIQKAYAFIAATYDLVTFKVIINVGAGAFACGTCTGFVGGPTSEVMVRGAGSTLTTLNSTFGLSGVIDRSRKAARLALDKVTLAVATAGRSMRCDDGQVVLGDNIDFNPADLVIVPNTTNFCITAYKGKIKCEAGTIQIQCAGKTYTSIFNMQDSEFEEWGNWNCGGATPDTVAVFLSGWNSKWVGSGIASTGVLTGMKFKATNMSFFNSYNGGVGVWPGSAPGIWDTSSFYDGVIGATAWTPYSAADEAAVGDDDVSAAVAAPPPVAPPRAPSPPRPPARK